MNRKSEGSSESHSFGFGTSHGKSRNIAINHDITESLVFIGPHSELSQELLREFTSRDEGFIDGEGI